MRTIGTIRRVWAFAVAAALLLTACGPQTAAATMRLIQTEGTVTVADGAGKDIALKKDLGLYSGYQVDTRSESYAWINLDQVKLTKMDQDSEIAIKKEDKHLEIEVKSGALFFNITEPLAEDETLNIRTSTMAVGIRGTCGWVEAPDGERVTLYLLEGTVECTAGEERATVNAGERAVVTDDGEIFVAPFPAVSVPEFVRVELEEDDALTAAILEASGLDPLNPVDPADDAARRAALLEALDQNSGASYAGLFDMDGDGREDLVVLNKIGQYSYHRWSAYLWDGSEARPVDLIYDDFSENSPVNSTDEIYTVTASVCRRRDTGVIYVHYYGEVIGGSYADYFISTADAFSFSAPFWGGGMHGDTQEEHEEWRRQTELEQQQYDTMLANRFETLEVLELANILDPRDYTYTLDQVRQQLTAG